MKQAKFQGVTTPIEDLAVAIQNQGWQLGQVAFDDKLNAYTAVAISPHGEQLQKTGPDAGTAVANALLAVTRRNHMRSAAQYKVGMWRTNWHERQQEIAEAYRDAPIYDPKAVAAWKALADHSMHALHVLGGQLHIEPTNNPQPYASADDMRKDVHEKRHYYLTRGGSAHPVWTADQVAAFRAVHDILGHGVAGGHYDWPGRNLAAAAHAPLLEPLAQQALFAETVARQAHLNTYGHGPIKIALFPDFVDHHQAMNQGAAHRGIHPSQLTAPTSVPQPFEQKISMTDPHVPPMNELQRFIERGSECFETARSLDEAYPHLKWQEGDYHRDDGTNMGPHAWVTTPSGTIVDTSHSQHDPTTPIVIAAPGTPEHARYESTRCANCGASEYGCECGDYRQAKTAAATTIDVNKHWSSGVDPLPYNAYVHHGDPMEAKATLDNAALIDTGWSQFKRGDGTDDRDRMKLAIVNAFRVVLLSPRKDLRWNAIHYQDISHIPGSVDDPKVYWDTLEASRRKWNEAQGIDPNAHMIYFKFLKPFEARIAAQHPEKGWEWAKQEASQTLFNWWTEEQERIAAEDSEKPAEKQRGADEIERRANEALAKRLQLFLKPKDDKTDVEDTQMSMFGARKESVEYDEMMRILTGEPSQPPVPREETAFEKRRREWREQRDREIAEERALFERDPQAYYDKTWGGEGDVTHPYYGQYIEWVPTQHMLPYAEWKRNPAHGAPAGESATADYWNILKTNIMREGIKNPIRLHVHPEDGMGHIGEGNHRLAVAEALGMSHVPVTVIRSKRRGNAQAPVPNFDDEKLRYEEMIRPSQIGLPVREQRTAAGGQYNLLTGEEALKYGAFMGTHLKSISQISQHADEILDAALADVREHDATGHHFRHAVLALNVPGVGPKVCSFAWLLLQPLTSQLATIDVHMMDVLGHNYEKEMNNRDYFKFEREFRAGLDAAGYGHLPLGAAQWGMWDYKRTGPGSHQDHSAMRVLDPKPHQEVNWAAKSQPIGGDLATAFKKNWADSVDWWAATKPHREQIGQEWDQTYGKNFGKNVVPYQDVTGVVAKIAYGTDFEHYWDKLMPVGSSVESKARRVAEYAKADDMSYGDLEEWLEDHKKDTKLEKSEYARFTKLVLRKMDRLSKVAGPANKTGTIPTFKHPETGKMHQGMEGQSMMEHARLQLGLSTQDVWRMLADEHVTKV